jgi:glucose/mannose-6-phosphate isomerase
MLHDDDGNADLSAAVSASCELAERRGVPVSALVSAGDSPVERFASLVGLVDYASVYLALLQSIDPTPVAPIDELKSRLA